MTFEYQPKAQSLNEYLEMLRGCGVNASMTKNEAPTVKYVSYDSRDVRPDTLFLCKGNNFRPEYLEDAIRKGATCYLADRDFGVSVPGVIVDDLRRSVAAAARHFYDYPDRSLRILTLTGTKGKSTTLMFLSAIFKHWLKKQGLPPAGVVSTLDTFDGFDHRTTHMTTPEPLELFQIMRSCVEAGLSVLLMETSSQALKYGRTFGLTFEVAGFLNISPDHISPVEHADFEDYFSSKLRIFKQTKHAVVNLDSDHAARILREASACETVATTSLEQDASYRGKEIHYLPDGFSMDVEHEGTTTPYEVHIHGSFNAQNALMAIAIADVFGVDGESIAAGLKSAVALGRMEFYPSRDRSVVCLVDFAHNGFSFDTVFESMKRSMPEYRQVAVFGTVGNKSENRRKEMGVSAGAHVDFCVLTQDDNDREPVSAINAEIAKYLKIAGCPYLEIEDRPQAIRRAVFDAGEHFRKTGERTLVLVLGRGDEDTMRVDGGYIPCPTDGETVRRTMKEYDASPEGAATEN